MTPYVILAIFVAGIFITIYVIRHTPKEPIDWAYFDDGDGMPSKHEVKK